MSDESGYSILLVDDEPVNLHVLNRILKDNYEVYAARYGQAAIKKALEDKPDLILLDVMLPDMSGFEVLSEIRKNDITRNIPVIFITGLSDAENEKIGLRLGAADYITKPFNSDVVKARVEYQIKIVEQIRIIEGSGMTDVLTELPNKRSFEDQLNVEWGRFLREKTPLSMMMIDVDRLKSYNSTYGHEQGDIILKELANILRATLKRATDMVFRWGGEEFAVLLPGTTLNNAIMIAERIRVNVEAIKIPGNGKELAATVSIGVSEATADGDAGAEDFLLRAENSLHCAKMKGRNSVCF